jgi:hypothetical protein
LCCNYQVGAARISGMEYEAESLETGSLCHFSTCMPHSKSLA